MTTHTWALRNVINVFAIAAIFVGGFFAVNTVQAATDQTLFGNASIVSDQLQAGSDTSDADPDNDFGGAIFPVTPGMVLNDLTELSTDFNVTNDDCAGGAPRFQVRLDMDDTGTISSGDENLFVYLGPHPSFTGCVADTWTASGDLTDSTETRFDTSQFGGTFYDTFANAQTLAGTKQVLRISVAVDAGWALPDNEQTVLFDNVTINGSVYDFTDTSPTTRSVPSEYSTIQAAVDAASPGDTISVGAGTYEENVVVHKSVTLEGANSGIAGNATRTAESIIDGGGISSPVRISADDIVLDGFTIKGGYNGLGVGVYALGSNNNTQILNNIITDNAIGVYPSGNDFVIRQNLFDSNNQPGAAGGAGIYTDIATMNLMIDDNELKNHTNNNPIILGATAAGIHQNVSVTDNNIHDNVSGLFILSVATGTFTGNTISAPAATALSFSGGNSDITVSENTINGSARGIRVGGSPAADFDFGFGNDVNILINNNQFTGNTEFAVGNLSGYTGELDATCNWWGAASGPGPVGSGTGDKVTTNVDFTPWLTSATGPCNGPLVGPPTHMDQCKNDGWMTFNNPSFSNQGECVSFVQPQPPGQNTGDTSSHPVPPVTPPGPPIIPPGQVLGITSPHSHGSLISYGQTIYLIVNGVKHPFRDADEFLSHGYNFSSVVAASSGDNGLNTGAVLKAMDGTLVLDTTDNRTVYIIGNNGTKRGFASATVFRGLGYNFGQAKKINLSDYSTGDPITSTTAPHPDGSLVISGNTIWWINKGQRHGFASMEILNSYGWDSSKIIRANAADMNLPQGSMMQLRSDVLISGGLV